MPKSYPVWTVNEHGTLRALEDNLLYVDSVLPGMALRRCMSIARMASGQLVVHNAVALGDEEMAQIDALGPVAYILVPSGFHRLDDRSFSTMRSSTSPRRAGAFS